MPNGKVRPGSIAEAARLIGISHQALRQRVEKGTAPDPRKVGSAACAKAVTEGLGSAASANDEYRRIQLESMKATAAERAARAAKISGATVPRDEVVREARMVGGEMKIALQDAMQAFALQVSSQYGLDTGAVTVMARQALSESLARMRDRLSSGLMVAPE